jgi:hypothetical protein
MGIEKAYSWTKARCCRVDFSAQGHSRHGNTFGAKWEKWSQRLAERHYDDQKDLEPIQAGVAFVGRDSIPVRQP